MRGTILRTSATTPLSNWRSFVKFKHYLRRQPSWDPLLFFCYAGLGGGCGHYFNASCQRNQRSNLVSLSWRIQGLKAWIGRRCRTCQVRWYRGLLIWTEESIRLVFRQEWYSDFGTPGRVWKFIPAMPPSLGPNLLQSGTHSWRKAIFKHTLI